MNFSLILLLFAPGLALASPVPGNLLLEMNGKIFPKDTFPETCKDFLRGARCDSDSYGKVHIQSNQEGDVVHSITVFSDPTGAQVTEESWERGGHVQKATIENKAIQKKCELEVKGDKVFYTVKNLKDGSIKTSDDDAESNLVVPSTVMAYIRPKFNALAGGDEVKLRVAVLDRREAFTFVIKKVREEKTIQGDEVMVLQMSPTSIFVKALVDPMFFYVKPKTGEMYAFEGKSALRRKVGDDYKEMVVRTAYEYAVNHFPVSEGPTMGAAPCTDDMKSLNSVKCSVPTINGKEENASKTSVQN